MGSNRKMHYKPGLMMPCLNGMKYCSLKWNAFSFYWVHLSSFWWSHGRACIGLTQNLNIHQNQYDCSARYFMEIVISNAIVILKLYWKTSLKMEMWRMGMLYYEISVSMEKMLSFIICTIKLINNNKISFCKILQSHFFQ